MLDAALFAPDRSAIDAPIFAMCLAGGVAAGVVLWLFVCSFAAKIQRIDIVVALRFGALAYAGLLAYPIAALSPLGALRGPVAQEIAVTLGIVGTLIAIARFNRALRISLFTFAIVKLPIAAVAELSGIVIGARGAHPLNVSTNPLLNVFARWDAVHYLDIARRGYQGTDVAFFPLYPCLIRVVGWLIGSDLIAALVLANVAFLVASVFLYRLAAAQWNEAVAARAILYLSVFPTAMFFMSAYTESLFLALTLGMFFYIRENRWLLAGFLGGLAALTRVEGVLLVVCYLVEIFAPERNLWIAIRTSRLVRRHFAIGACMIPAGLGAYMLLSWMLSNDPLSFTHAQSHWHRALSWPWTSVARSLDLIVHSHDPATVALQTMEFTFAGLVLWATVAGFRKLRPSYTMYALLSLLVPLSTSTLMSTPRFALTVFPMFLVFAIWGAREQVHTAILVCSLCFLGLFTALFANWYWVA